MTHHIDTLRFERLFFNRDQDHVFVEGRDGVENGRIPLDELDGLRDFLTDICHTVDELEMTPSSPRLWKMAPRDSDAPARNLMVDIVLARNLTAWIEIRNLPLDYPMDDPEAQKTYDVVEAILLRRESWSSTHH